MQVANHNWNAEDYARNSSAQFAWALELIEKLALQGNESVLDIGCGDGKVTAYLAHILDKGRVLGIDAAAEMVERAALHFPPERYPNLSFARMDAAQIVLSERFDWAFSSAALHWVADHKAVLRSTHSCLKPEGRILFQMGGRGNAKEVSRIVQEVTGRPQWQRYFDGFTFPYHFYGPEDYEQWLAQSGFCPRRVELIPKDMQHQGRQGLKGWLRTTWFPYTDRFPVGLRDVFLDQVVELYTALYPLDAQGNTHVNMVRLEVEAHALT